MYREESDDDMVDFYDDLEFLKGLGMEAHSRIAYYWVLDDEMIQYWVPSDNLSGYLHGGCYPDTELPLEEVCAALNARTKDVFGKGYGSSHSSPYTQQYMRDDRDRYMEDHPCILVEGGPLDGKCCIGPHCFPTDIVDTLGLMVTDHIYHPDHDLWELTRHTNTLDLWLSTYLVTDAKYIVAVDTSYSNGPQYTLVPRAEEGYTDNTQVVCVGTLQECTDLMDHLGEVYAQGIAYMRSRVMEVCEE